LSQVFVLKDAGTTLISFVRQFISLAFIVF